MGHPNFVYGKGDISSDAMMGFLPWDDFDYVINCAAESHVDRSWGDISGFVQSNIQGPINLALRCKGSPKLKKFVQVSTDEVFHYRDNWPSDETSKISPRNIYSSSKASAEHFLLNFWEAYGLPLVITNGANTYGPRQYKEKLIPKTIYKLSKGEQMTVYKTPARRMWLHVEDHSRGIIAAMERGAPGQRYCLAPDISDEHYTSDVVKMIAKHLYIEDPIEYVEDRENYDLRYYMSSIATPYHLGWKAERCFKEELSGVVKWYLDEFSI
jgi:dTDP-glucose 4,6-dehydratase